MKNIRRQIFNAIIVPHKIVRLGNQLMWLEIYSIYRDVKKFIK